MTLELASPEVITQVLKEIDCDEKQIQNSLETLTNWLNLQPHLPKVLAKSDLIAILVAYKNRIQRCKEFLENYWTVRNTCSEFYENRDPCDPEVRECAKNINYFPLPKMTPKEHYRINIFSINDPDPKKFCLRNIMKRITLISDVRRHNESYYSGDIVVFDFRNLTFSHLGKLMPSLLSKVLYCGQEAIASRLKGFYVINADRNTERVVNLFKQFLKKKLINRIHVFSEGYKALHKFFPKEILPKEYEGEAGSLSDLNNAWQKRIESQREWLMTICNQSADETKRPKDSIIKNSDFFGADGSFKKLSLD